MIDSQLKDWANMSEPERRELYVRHNSLLSELQMLNEALGESIVACQGTVAAALLIQLRDRLRRVISDSTSPG